MKTVYKVGIGAIVIAAIIIMAYMYLEINDLKKSKKDLEKSNKDLEDENKILTEDKLKLWLESMNANNDLTSEVRKQLLDLLQKFEQVDPIIASKISKALEKLVDDKDGDSTITDLVIIIENMLSDFYSENSDFKNWNKEKKGERKGRVTLHNALEYCRKIDNKITEIEFDFFMAIKAIRNANIHEKKIILDTYITISGLLVAIQGIIKIASFVYPNNFSKCK